MRCDRCFFCTHIGAGIYAEYPVKYCKRSEKYILPIITRFENGKPVETKLNLKDIEDLKVWHSVGCNIHPNTVKAAIKKFIKSLEVDE